MTERFELLERVGKGGMGVVWRARDGETGEIVALKLLHAIYAEEPDYVARFEREVEVARRIDSPHVVRVFGYGLREGVPYMAMEYVGGQSLRELIKAKGKLTWEEAKPLLRQVAAGLEAAHKAGVIHRDVKPSNILIAPDGSAKLADFGIARAADLTALTGSSTMLGTPHYMAPEGEGTEAGDLYSLGCVLFEMLTGAPPFEGDSVHTIILRHLRDEPDLRPLPGPAIPVASVLLSKEPGVRLEKGPGAIVAATAPPVRPPSARSIRPQQRRLHLRLIRTISVSGPVACLAFGEAEQILAVATEDAVLTLHASVRDGQHPAPARRLQAVPACLLFASHGRWLYAGSDVGIAAIDAMYGTQVGEIRSHPVRLLAVGGTSNGLESAGGGERDVLDGIPPVRYSAVAPRQMALASRSLSVGPRLIATVGRDRGRRFWRLPFAAFFQGQRGGPVGCRGRGDLTFVLQG